MAVNLWPEGQELRSANHRLLQAEGTLIQRPGDGTVEGFIIHVRESRHYGSSKY